MRLDFTGHIGVMITICMCQTLKPFLAMEVLGFLRSKLCPYVIT